LTTGKKIKLDLNQSAALNDAIIDAIQDIKGENILKYDLTYLHDAPADFFIICEGNSNTQVKAISDSVHKKVKDKLMLMPNHVEGAQGARWILLDYFSVIVHVFYKETRPYYNLEQLWSDARVTEYQNIK
jgi:ribosome-associated protein